MAEITRLLLRVTPRLVSSSIENTTPASGALKAAAIPAAPPATIRAWSLRAEPERIQWRALCITPAATCTEGPSRPAESPASRLPAPSPILARVSFMDTKWRRATEFTWGSMAAMTWGMPEPEAPGT